MSSEVLPPGVAVNHNHIEDRDAYSKDLDNGLGLSHDELQLRAQGHVAELPRRFSWLATLALAFSITNTWIGYSATFVVPLLAGAGRAVVCCLILACVASTIIAAGLAELASAFPSSGGQYQSVKSNTLLQISMLSPTALRSWFRVRRTALRLHSSSAGSVR